MNPPVAERLLRAAVLGAAWASYLQVGVKYLCLLGAALCAARLLHRDRRWPVLRGEPGIGALLIFLALLAVSSAWSGAPPADVVAHLWGYALLLLVPLLACAVPPALGQRALLHFVAASALFGALVSLATAGLLPDGPALWPLSVRPTGNQRIALSLLLALGATLALALALQPAAGQPARRPLLLAAALLAALGVVLQDRRSGMVVLPLLLMVIVLAQQKDWPRRAALVAAVITLAGATWALSDGVRARFTEGLGELRAAETAATVASSWGQRARMAEITAAMVAERPLFGHGVGSWVTLWQQRTAMGSPLAQNSTPHSELLLVATQVGFVGLALLACALGAPWVAAWRSGTAGLPGLLVWTAVLSAGLFNAVLRDVKFALPLIALAAFATAARR